MRVERATQIRTFTFYDLIISGYDNFYNFPNTGWKENGLR